MPTKLYAELEPGDKVLGVVNLSDYRNYLARTPFVVLAKHPHSYDVVLSDKTSKRASRGELLDKTALQVESDTLSERLDAMKKGLGVHYWGTWGADPEIFIQDSKHKLVPAFKFLPAKTSSKTYFWDGFQAEFITKPMYCLEYHTSELHNGLFRLKDAGKPNYRFLLKDVVRIPQEDLDSAEDVHVRLGCEPSKNIYGIQGEAIPNPRKLPYRFAGGHIHFGLAEYFDQKWPVDNVTAVQIVRPLDAILGVCSIALFGALENPIRRKFYGLPGEYRLPKHGLEYRTLSNYWLLSPEICFLTYEIARIAMGTALSGLFDSLWQAKTENVVNCILRSDVDMARNMIAQNEAFLLGAVKERFSQLGWTAEQLKSIVKNTRAILMEGVRKFFPRLNTIEANWFDTEAYCPIRSWGRYTYGRDYR